jgi:anti-anti-sigma regulatory factor
VKNGNAKFGRAIIPNETLQDIVMNISQIYDLDSAFLKALEDRMETWYRRKAFFTKINDDKSKLFCVSLGKKSKELATSLRHSVLS